MKFNVQSLVRENISELTPYSSARDEFVGKASIYLDANENPYSTSVNRYPDPYQKNVKENIYRLKKVPYGNIFLGNGSDEVIDLLFRAFCKPSVDNIILLPPTYGRYGVSAKINDVTTIEIVLNNDFQPDTNRILESVNENTKLIFICSPNNPTGNLIDKNRIEHLLKSFNGLVIVDEAYIDFEPGQSILPFLEAYENLVILQTFSKAWGLAGIRLGMAFASADIVKILNKIKPPYNIDSLSQNIAIKALQRGRPEMLKEQIEQREMLANALEKFNFVDKVFPSNANFILIKTKSPQELYNHLINQGIVIRDRSKQILCDGCLRISIGTAMENKNLLEALDDFDK